MSDRDANARPGCARYSGDLAEMAIGILTGRERAMALAHVEGCATCQAEMEQLSLAADSLLEVVPTIEPPLGFEVRLMDRLGSPRVTPRAARGWSGLRRSSLLATCVLVLVAVGAGIAGGWFARGSERPAQTSAFGTEPGGSLQAESLVDGGRTVGEVTVYSGKKSWVYMTLDDGSWSGKAVCQVRLADGTTVPLGTFWLDKGYGAWGVTLPAGTGPIETASVVSGKNVLATARFGPASTLFVWP